MKYDQQRHHRRSIRLKGYDYTQPGYYFITICLNQNNPLLGRFHNNIWQPSPAGTMVQTIWDEIPQFYPGVNIDAFVVMPDHVHGIIILENQRIAMSSKVERSPHPEEAMSLGDVVHRFKSLTTARYRHGVRQQNWQPFERRLWQRNYYEQIIRDETILNAVREYIINNPWKWEQNVDHRNQYHPQPQSF